MFASYEMLYWLKRRRTHRRRYWVHSIFKIRQHFGECHHLLEEVLRDKIKCLSYLRMTPTTFHLLLEMISPSIEKRETNFRKPLSPKERLVITIRFLAEGESPPALSFHFRAGVSTIRGIISETCKALWDVLQPLVMPKPDANKWIEIANDFYGRFQFPMCLGALDGKHIRLKKTNNSGSKYYNYKGYFSIVLLAVTDVDGKFVVVDIGSCGGNSDAGVFNRSKFGKALVANKLDIPQPAAIPETDITIPYMFVADDAFPLQENTMKPFSNRQLTHEKEVFNNRLIRARNTVECTFGRIAQTWRILLTQMDVQPIAATNIVKAITVLHNFINIHEPNRGTISREADELRDECVDILPSIQRPRCRSRNNALNVRDRLMEYFLSDRGRLDWQDAQCYS